MNRRTSIIWPLLFAWCMVMSYPDWSKFDLSDPNWIAAFVALLVIVCPAIYKGLRILYKYTVYQDDNFHLAILNHLPLSQYEEKLVYEPASVKVLPPGIHKLPIEVRATCRWLGFAVKNIDFRCLNRDFSDAGRSIAAITDVEDPFNQTIFSVRDDGHAGIYGEYADARGLKHRQCLYFEITLTANHEWSGMLSFRAKTSSGFPSYVRHAMEIRDGANQPIVPADWKGWTIATPSSIRRTS